MSKIDTQNISVLNYNENDVFVDSAKEHYKFNASRDGVTPTIQQLTLSELQYICSNTDIIVTGWLTFDDDEKDEIFTALRIYNWKDILTNKDMEEILTHPTIEGLQKIIDIDNQTYFDRVRIVMFKLIKNGTDVSSKVKRVVEQRYEELQKRKRISSIIINPRVTEQKASSAQVQELSEQNAKLQEQLDEMKKMMAQLMAVQNTSATVNESENDEKTINDVIKKKAGRPPKKAS